jgi:hypothetical protein
VVSFEADLDLLLLHAWQLGLHANSSSVSDTSKWRSRSPFIPPARALVREHRSKLSKSRRTGRS